MKGKNNDSSISAEHLDEDKHCHLCDSEGGFTHPLSMGKMEPCPRCNSDKPHRLEFVLG